MVLKKRLYYGEFHDFQVPVVPRAPRSLRRRSSFTKSVEDSEICAFDLLAAVAGKLLQESENSASSTAAEGKDQISIHKEVTKREAIEGKSVRSECLDQGSCSESLLVSEPAIQEQKINPSFKGSPNSESDSALEHASVITSCDLFKKVGCDVKLEVSQGKNEFGNIHNEPLTGYADYGEICHGNLANGAEVQVETIEKKTKNLTAITVGGLKDPVESCVNTHTVVNSHSNVQLPLYRDSIPNASFPRHRDNVKIGIRDDDENSFRCNHHSTKNRAFRAQSRAGYRRIRKMLTSRYWKVAPNYEISNTSGGVKPFYCNRKTVNLRDRYQGEAASKRRKLYYHSSRTAYLQEASVSNSIEKTTNGDKRRLPAAFHRAAAGVTSSAIGHKSSFQSKDTHVKFSIKSFKVPELYIEVPETATVGSLKRTVMEAITTILGGDLRVGVLLQGKKVRDDNRTLQQTGISQSSNLDSLGFMLEPSLTQASPSLVQKEHPFLLPCETLQQLLRSPDRPAMEPGFSNSTFDPAVTTNIDNSVEKNHYVGPFPADVSMSERVPDSKAVVVMPPKNAEPLSIVPLNCKTKRSELSQRRTRRPFSVSEVEALVEAVEKLGTGRWRDVKMRAFDDANHRTYVDLKDKWKTLVHTASISPQQRRGEPVPQELLDRVLAAHAYWSQNQFKQHGKHQDESLQLSFFSDVN